MSDSGKTLRMIFPDTQHGANPSSGFVPRFLAMVAPQGEHAETIEVKAHDRDYEPPRNQMMAVRAVSLLSQEDYRGVYDSARQELDKMKPSHVITFSTDGAVSLAPIDYLHGQYDDLGVLWLDVHAEGVTPERFWKKRTVLFGGITGSSESAISSLMEKPLKPERLAYLCLKAQSIPTLDQVYLRHYAIRQFDESGLMPGDTSVIDWIRENGIRHLSVHVDLDSVGAADIRSGICREEDLVDVSLTENLPLRRLKHLLGKICEEAEIVGFDIMDYEMLDAPDFRELLDGLPIFKE